MISKFRTAALIVLVPLVLATLAACAPTVALEPAADATNPGCAQIIVRLPSTVAGLSIRQTNAQATGAWGSPAAVLLRCGVTPPGPTENSCVTVDGVDWVRSDAEAPRYIFTTFGRKPATQVVIDSSLTHVGGADVLDDLSNSVGSIVPTHKCTTSDNFGSGGTTVDATPAPSATP